MHFFFQKYLLLFHKSVISTLRCDLPSLTSCSQKCATQTEPLASCLLGGTELDDIAHVVCLGDQLHVASPFETILLRKPEFSSLQIWCKISKPQSISHISIALVICFSHWYLYSAYRSRTGSLRSDRSSFLMPAGPQWQCGLLEHRSNRASLLVAEKRCARSSCGSLGPGLENQQVWRTLSSLIMPSP